MNINVDCFLQKISLKFIYIYKYIYIDINKCEVVIMVLCIKCLTNY